MESKKADHRDRQRWWRGEDFAWRRLVLL